MPIEIGPHTTLDASIASIRTAIKTQLETLLRADPPADDRLLLVADWLGEVTRGRPIDLDALGQTPAALVAAAREAFEHQGTTTGETLIHGDSRWVIFLVVSDPQHPADQVPRMDALLDAVIGVLAGLRITGLWGTSLLELLDWSPFRVERGCIVYAITARAVRQVDSVANATVGDLPSEYFNEFQGDVSLAETSPTDEPAANPIAIAGGDP